MMTFAVDLLHHIRMIRALTVKHDIGNLFRDSDGNHYFNGVVLHIPLKLQDPEFGREFSRTRILTLVMCGHSNTFGEVGPRGVTHKGRVSTLEDLTHLPNISNHDSCWADAISDLVTKAYFEMAEEINEALCLHLKDSEAGRAPREMESTAHLFSIDSSMATAKFRLQKQEGTASYRDQIVGIVDFKTLSCWGGRL